MQNMFGCNFYDVSMRRAHKHPDLSAILLSDGAIAARSQAIYQSNTQHVQYVKQVNLLLIIITF